MVVLHAKLSCVVMVNHASVTSTAFRLFVLMDSARALRVPTALKMERKCPLTAEDPDAKNVVHFTLVLMISTVRATCAFRMSVNFPDATTEKQMDKNQM